MKNMKLVIGLGVLMFGAINCSPKVEDGSDVQSIASMGPNTSYGNLTSYIYEFSGDGTALLRNTCGGWATSDYEIENCFENKSYNNDEPESVDYEGFKVQLKKAMILDLAEKTEVRIEAQKELDIITGKFQKPSHIGEAQWKARVEKNKRSEKRIRKTLSQRKAWESAAKTALTDRDAADFVELQLEVKLAPAADYRNFGPTNSVERSAHVMVSQFRKAFDAQKEIEKTQSDLMDQIQQNAEKADDLSQVSTAPGQ